MHLIYTQRTSDFDSDKNYRNPNTFYRADIRATKVTIEGEYPEIVKAYEEAGIDIEAFDASTADQVKTDVTFSKLTVEELKQRLIEANIEFSPDAKKAELIKLLQGNEQ